jgi:hypothetical protein
MKWNAKTKPHFSKDMGLFLWGIVIGNLQEYARAEAARNFGMTSS